MTHITRRRFLEDSLLAAAAMAGGPALARAAQDGGTAPKRNPLRVAVVGVRGRGRGHIKAFKNSPDSEVVALCDVDEGVLGPAMAAVPEATYYRDLRDLLEDGSIDVVSVATPNHWHVLASLWALQAGKHVYVEKPLGHNVLEGRELVNAAESSGLVVQHGTQARSYAATREAIAWLREGGLGKVRLARGLCYKRRDSIGKVAGPQEPPATLDHDLWTGPAELRPLRRKHLHYDWHWDFNTGNGDIGNQGVHQMDIARWGLGQAGFPRRVVSLGGRLGYDDDGETPNTQIAIYDYGDQKLIFEVRGLLTEGYRNTTVGVVFHCDEGYLVSAAYGKVVAFDPDGLEMKVFTGEGDHVQNFLDAIRSGSPEKLNAPSLEGHISSGLCHLGNISYLLGESTTLSAHNRPLGDDEDADDSFLRLKAHLADNGIGSPETVYRLGASLAFDPAREIFVGERAAEASALLGRKHREPYVLPTIG